MNIQKSRELTNAEKTELLKEEMGWYFDGVAPRDWNPCERVRHLQPLLKHVAKEGKKITLDEAALDILILPFENPAKVVDLCGNALGLWQPAF